MIDRVEYRDKAGSVVSYPVAEFVKLPIGSRNQILSSEMIEFYDKDRNIIEASVGRKLVFNVLYKKVA